jgi:hypothetical protein
MCERYQKRWRAVARRSNRLVSLRLHGLQANSAPMSRQLHALGLLGRSRRMAWICSHTRLIVSCSSNSLVSLPPLPRP